jgi:hypothetical protein
MSLSGSGADPWSARVPLDPLSCKEINLIQSRRADEGAGCGPGGPTHHIYAKFKEHASMDDSQSSRASESALEPVSRVVELLDV